MKNIKYSFSILFAFVTLVCHAQKLKAITYNIEFAKNTTPEEMATYLKAEKADIICFNEVPGQGWTIGMRN